MTRINQVVGGYRTLLFSVLVTLSCSSASAGIWWPGFGWPGFCCDPPRAYCTPECHPTWGHHQTCWRQFPPLQPCCGWGDYCATDGNCQTCQTCQPGHSGHTNSVYTENFVPNNAITGNNGVILNGNNIGPMGGPVPSAPVMNGVNSLPAPQALSPAPVTTVPGQSIPGPNGAGSTTPFQRAIPNTPIPMPQGELPMHPQQLQQPAAPVPGQTYNYNTPASGQVYSAAQQRMVGGTTAYSGIPARPVTYQNPVSAAPTQPQPGYVATPTAPAQRAESPTGQILPTSVPVTQSDKWTDKAKSNAGKLWTWFRSPAIGSNKGAAPSAPESQKEPQKEPSPTRLQSIRPRISAWKR